MPAAYKQVMAEDGTFWNVQRISDMAIIPYTDEDYQAWLQLGNNAPDPA
jgi:hypothetical protein